MNEKKAYRGGICNLLDEKGSIVWGSSNDNVNCAEKMKKKIFYLGHSLALLLRTCEWGKCNWSDAAILRSGGARGKKELTCLKVSEEKVQTLSFA